jgi:hypothetical protein
MLLGNFFSNIDESTIWFTVLIVIMVIHAIWGHSKTLLPKLLHIRGIVTGYKLVFPNIWDLIYLMALVTIVTRITILKVPSASDVTQEYTQVGVIVTLLVAAMMDIMSMSIGRGENLQSAKDKDQTYEGKLKIITDIVRIGLFEVLIGFIDLILIFLIESMNGLVLKVLRAMIYWIFYLFSFNILAIMHKLYLLYSEYYKNNN